MCFNSQRDGILQSWGKRRLLRHRVSIPNGMEFYENYNFVNMKITFMVSIPNGMEFYTEVFSDMRSQGNRFNSQRDGILQRKCTADISDLRRVSIPNGMEFYIYMCCKYLPIARFNSQRDGILQTAVEAVKLELMFQFPTGWNSTDISSAIIDILSVSIPNGMEFYQMLAVFTLPFWRFNSQRDGILRSLILAS